MACSGCIYVFDRGGQHHFVSPPTFKHLICDHIKISVSWSALWFHLCLDRGGHQHFLTPLTFQHIFLYYHLILIAAIMDFTMQPSASSSVSTEQQRIRQLLQDAVVKLCQENLQFHEVRSYIIF